MASGKIYRYLADDHVRLDDAHTLGDKAAPLREL